MQTYLDEQARSFDPQPYLGEERQYDTRQEIRVDPSTEVGQIVAKDWRGDVLACISDRFDVAFGYPVDAGNNRSDQETKWDPFVPQSAVS